MDPITLYKLMILYLLKAVRFPLTRSQLSDFFLMKEYCSYSTFQQVTAELLDAHLMTEKSIRNFIRYTITREGEDTLEYFGKDLPTAIRSDMDEFLAENMIHLREELGSVCEYQESENGEYITNLEICEGQGTLLHLSLTVPTEEQAKIICDNWRESDQNVYEAIMKELLRD